jgi:hypothetical protein
MSENKPEFWHVYLVAGGMSESGSRSNQSAVLVRGRESCVVPLQQGKDHRALSDLELVVLVGKSSVAPSSFKEDCKTNGVCVKNLYYTSGEVRDGSAPWALEKKRDETLGKVWALNDKILLQKNNLRMAVSTVFVPTQGLMLENALRSWRSIILSMEATLADLRQAQRELHKVEEQLRGVA